MVKGKAAYFVIGIVVISALGLRLFSKEDDWICVNGAWTKHGNPRLAQPSEACPVSEVNDNQKFILEGELATSTQATTSDAVEIKPENISTTSNESVPLTYNQDYRLATIEAPQANSVISSPLVVKGEAPGPWFFEASFPVKLLDNDGNLIVASQASPQSDPLTENFVPYKALLEFSTTATSGYLVLNNDNPSGLPENSRSVKIPVLFLNK